MIRRDERALAVTVGGVEVASYVFHDPTCDPFEGPKPYLHPIRTLAGHVITDFRPADHLWHKGLQMTLTDVSGQNFWGGNTYIDGEGYVALDNVGSIRHDGFDAITESAEAAEATVEERLTWVTRAGAPWLSERRRLRFHGLDVADGVWALELTSRLTNIHADALTLGSPATRGRVGVGYSGAFLRLAATFTGATVVTPGPVSHPGADADRLMGATLPWLAFASDDATVVALAGRPRARRRSGGSSAHCRNPSRRRRPPSTSRWSSPLGATSPSGTGGSSPTAPSHLRPPRRSPPVRRRCPAG
nr:DUF6807 family protein [Tessaracoccus coleopterorum]